MNRVCAAILTREEHAGKEHPLKAQRSQLQYNTVLSNKILSMFLRSKHKSGYNSLRAPLVRTEAASTSPTQIRQMENWLRLLRRDSAGVHFPPYTALTLMKLY